MDKVRKPKNIFVQGAIISPENCQLNRKPREQN